MRLAIALFLVAATAAPARAQYEWASPLRTVARGHDYPVVELITIGVGARIWERHGHIALCIVYADPGQDACYNYGIGDFSHPLSMVLGFFRGTNSFWAGRLDPQEMLAIYRYADRTIWVQPLPLTDPQKQAVIAKLEHDVLPQYRYYAYDHFWDNCTTRVRNVLDHATGGALSSMHYPTDGRTYRDLARAGFFGIPHSRLALLATDLAMGPVTDRVPTYYQRMFLPEYMRVAAQKLWGVKPVAVYTRRGPPAVRHGPSGRVLFALVLLLLTAPAWATRLWGRFERTGLWVALVPQLLLGTLLWVLAIISPLPYVRWNESCLVLVPLDVLLVAFLAPERRRIYARGRIVMLAVLAGLLAVGVLKQPLWEVLLWPLVPCAVVAFWPPRPPEPDPEPEPARPPKQGAPNNRPPRKKKKRRR